MQEAKQISLSLEIRARALPREDWVWISDRRVCFIVLLELDDGGGDGGLVVGVEEDWEEEEDEPPKKPPKDIVSCGGLDGGGEWRGPTEVVEGWGGGAGRGCVLRGSLVD